VTRNARIGLLLPLFVALAACGGTPDFQFDLPKGRELVITHISNRRFMDEDPHDDKTTIVLTLAIVSGGRLGRDSIRLAAEITRVMVDTRPSQAKRNEQWDSENGPPPDLDVFTIFGELVGLTYDIEIRPDRSVVVSNIEWRPQRTDPDAADEVSLRKLMSKETIARSLQEELSSSPIGVHAEKSQWAEDSVDWEFVSVAGGVARLTSTIESPGDGPVLTGKLEFDLTRRRPIRYAVSAEIVTESSRGDLTIVIEELTTYAIR